MTRLERVWTGRVEDKDRVRRMKDGRCSLTALERALVEGGMAERKRGVEERKKGGERRVVSGVCDAVN